MFLARLKLPRNPIHNNSNFMDVGALIVVVLKRPFIWDRLRKVHATGMPQTNHGKTVARR